MLTFLIFTSLLLQVTVQGAHHCRDGWVYHNDRCYLFVSLYETWVSAAGHCRSLYSDLAVIETADENRFLKSNTKHLHSNHGFGSFFWLGGTDIGLDGHWEWVASFQVKPFVFKDWANHEPDNREDEDCMGISGQDGYDWADDLCLQSHNFICEEAST